MPTSEESTTEIMERLHVVPDVEEDDWLALGAALKKGDEAAAKLEAVEGRVAGALATLRAAQATQPARGHLLEAVDAAIAQLTAP